MTVCDTDFNLLEDSLRSINREISYFRMKLLIQLITNTGNNILTAEQSPDMSKR